MTVDTLWLPPADPGLTRLDGEVWMAWGSDDQLHPVQLEDMTPEHRWHVLQWLRRNAELMQAHERAWITGLFRSRTITLDRFAERLDILDVTAAEVWIEDTALVRRLHNLIRRDRDRGRCDR